MSDANEPAKRTGVAATVWDNIGQGWRMYCLCDWATDCSDDLEYVAADMDIHWRTDTDHAWPMDGSTHP